MRGERRAEACPHVQLCVLTHLVVEIQALESRHRLGELRQLGDRLHRGALAAVEEPGFSLPLPEHPAPQGRDHVPDVEAVLGPAVVLAQHVSGQRLLRQLERLHVVDDKRLLGAGGRQGVGGLRRRRDAKC